jgi:hypothetical protein
MARCNHKEHWRVLRRHWTRSAFDGYKKRWSKYSDVVCLKCVTLWRTKAAYVEELEDAKHNEWRDALSRDDAAS